MIRARALDVLLRAGCRLGRDRQGRLVATNVPAELRPVIDQIAADLALGVAGHDRRKTFGHEWRRCNACGQEQIRPSAAGETGCRMTPGCDGKAVTYTDPPPLELAGQPVPCERPGCNRPASHLTATHEALCESDFTHLALANEHRRNTT